MHQLFVVEKLCKNLYLVIDLAKLVVKVTVLLLGLSNQDCFTDVLGQVLEGYIEFLDLLHPIALELVSFPSNLILHEVVIVREARVAPRLVMRW